jgi:SAM-dependent methyltransferase
MTKSFLERSLPRPLLNYYWDLQKRRLRRRLQGLSVKEVFTLIYSERLWGRPSENDDRFFSGSGSHDPRIVERYVAAVGRWVSSLDAKPDVVDLGCGDFAVGAKLRRLCGNYIACDVVEPLIQRNRERFKDLNVDFRVVDLTADELPQARVAFLRQVLQHLSNDAISAIVPKLQQRYEYLVLTEHLQPSAAPDRNVDKPAGPDWRGVVLTAEPFNLQVAECLLLCEAREQGGIIRTHAYRLR